MIDHSERLRRMANYSFHMQRADQERERATGAADRVARGLHSELALLHEIAAADLTHAWKPFAAAPNSVEAARKAYEAALADC